jgi:hypothetical protein
MSIHQSTIQFNKASFVTYVATSDWSKYFENESFNNVTCYTMHKSYFYRAVPKRAEEGRRKPKRAEESRREPTKAEVSRANKREECLYFVSPQRLATHVTRLAQQ